MFDNDIFTIMGDFGDLFDWDKKSYRFNREEKDMHPYSITSTKDNTIITHNVLGIEKKDLQIKKEIENGVTYMTISGRTEDTLTKNIYEVNSKFALDDNQLELSKIAATLKNGILYITIPNKKSIKKPSKETIEIL